MKSVLVADDEHDILLALELLLEEEGYRVFTASNGREALDRFVDARPDLIMLDVMMPIMTGLEALKELRSSPVGNDVPVILMSAIRPVGSIERGPETEFLAKPFDIDRVLKLIEKMLGAN